MAKGSRGGKRVRRSRLDIAKDLAREIYGYNISDQMAERYGRELMKFPDDYVFDEDEKYIEKDGHLERTTQDLRDWLERLRRENDEDIPF